MGKNLMQTIGTCEPDNLINQPHQLDAVMVKVKVDQGELPRGTVLLGEPGAALEVMGPRDAGGGEEPEAPKAEAVYVLCDPLATATGGAEPINAMAYRTGYFNRGSLTVKTGYKLTAADEELMRKCGIFLADAI